MPSIKFNNGFITNLAVLWVILLLSSCGTNDSPISYHSSLLGLSVPHGTTDSHDDLSSSAITYQSPDEVLVAAAVPMVMSGVAQYGFQVVVGAMIAVLGAATVAKILSELDYEPLGGFVDSHNIKDMFPVHTGTSAHHSVNPPTAQGGFQDHQHQGLSLPRQDPYTPITVMPIFGMDGLQSFLEQAKQSNIDQAKIAAIHAQLVQINNESAAALLADVRNVYKQINEHNQQLKELESALAAGTVSQAEFDESRQQILNELKDFEAMALTSHQVANAQYQRIQTIGELLSEYLELQKSYGVKKQLFKDFLGK